MQPKTDQQYVVVENGQRVTKTTTEAEALAEAMRRNQLAESKGRPQTEGSGAKVAVNLFG